METIPIGFVLENEKFKLARSQVKMIVVNCVYGICSRRHLKFGLPENLRPYSGCSDLSLWRNKQQVINILSEVLPKIAKFKRIKFAQVSNGQSASAKKAIEHRLQYQQGLLADNIGHNPAPLVPQLSAPAAKLSRERITSEAQFTRSLKPASAVPTSKPPLTEKHKP